MKMPKLRLTDERYWNQTWRGYDPKGELELEPNPIKRFLTDTSANRQLWKEILPRFLPRNNRMRIVELGSAPGRNLLRWREEFGYDIFGVDFSETGLEAQRETLARHRIDERHNIHADFLDPQFHREHADAFDVVYSAGVIEHFSDPHDAIAAHLKILKPSGILVISIPNIVGLYRHLLAQEVVEAHNLDIMRLSKFQALFDFPRLDRLFCDYYGTLYLGLAFGEATALHRALPKLQIMANLATRVIHVPENRWTSPYLLYIGRKRK